MSHLHHYTYYYLFIDEKKIHLKNDLYLEINKGVAKIHQICNHTNTPKNI